MEASREFSRTPRRLPSCSDVSVLQKTRMSHFSDTHHSFMLCNPITYFLPNYVVRPVKGGCKRTSPFRRAERQCVQWRAVPRIRPDQLVFGLAKDLQSGRISLRHLCVIPDTSQSVLSLIEQLACPWFSRSLVSFPSFLRPPSFPPPSPHFSWVIVPILHTVFCFIDVSLGPPHSRSAATVPDITNVAPRRSSPSPPLPHLYPHNPHHCNQHSRSHT